MNEDKKYEPIAITLEVGSRATALAITDALIDYCQRERGFYSVEGTDAAFEDIRIIGEALLSVYRSYKRGEEMREKFGR